MANWYKFRPTNLDEYFELEMRFYSYRANALYYDMLSGLHREFRGFMCPVTSRVPRVINKQYRGARI